MKHFVTRLVMASALAWVGASALISDNKDFWLKWGEMPELFKTGIGIAALFFQKFLPNLSVPSLSKGSSAPGTYKVLNLQPAHLKYAVRWLAGAAMVLATVAVPYGVLDDLIKHEWKAISPEVIKMASLIPGGILALAFFRAKTKRWDPTEWNRHSCNELPKLPPLFKTVGVPSTANVAVNQIGNPVFRLGGWVKLKPSLAKCPQGSGLTGLAACEIVRLNDGSSLDSIGAHRDDGRTIRFRGPDGGQYWTYRENCIVVA